MRRKYNLVVQHTTADGKVFTDEQFNGYVVKNSENFEFAQWAEPRLDRHFAAKEGLKRQYQKAAERKRELDKQQAEISAQLAELT